jgi:lysine biosynthesis protein LysW
MNTANCPFCETSLKVGENPSIGQLVKCHSCDAELQVVWLYPIELDAVDDLEWEDDMAWDDDEGDEEYAYEDDYSYDDDYDQS